MPDNGNRNPDENRNTGGAFLRARDRVGALRLALAEGDVLAGTS